MDNIKFLGYCADGTLKMALKTRKKHGTLEDFYKSVNQMSSSGCSCCRKETHKLYCIQPVGLPIKPTILSLCDECIRQLPEALTIINLSGKGSPPLLIDKIYESEV
jgi:hypothetical protein